MLGEHDNAEGSLADLAQWLVLIYLGVEEALGCENLFVTCLHGLLAVEVD